MLDEENSAKEKTSNDPSEKKKIETKTIDKSSECSILCACACCAVRCSAMHSTLLLSLLQSTRLLLVFCFSFLSFLSRHIAA